MNAPVEPLLGVSSRIPPANAQAEQALLGAILTNNRAFDATSGLRAEHFADPIHGRIFAEAAKLIQAGRVADAVTLKTIFEGAGVLQDVGGTAYLMQLMSAMVAPSMAGDYARVIRDAWMRRQVIDIGADALELAYGARTDIDGERTVATTIERLMTLGEQTGATNQATPLADAIAQALAASEAAARGTGASGLLTGIPTLDELWGGLWPSCLDCLGARSEHGKTALGMQIAVNVARSLLADHQQAVAAGQKHDLEHVEIYSLEMSAEQLGYRLLATETGISARDIRAGRINGANAEALLAAQADLNKLPILIQDTPKMSVSDIALAAFTSRRRKHTRLVIIDHLHIIKPAAEKARAPRNEQVQSITEGLKILSKTLKTPILLLAQLSRQSERREDHRPVVADIEYAGERDFDNICLLWRPELYLGDAPPPASDKLTAERRAEMAAAFWEKKDATRGKAEAILAKARMGPVGSVWLDFDGPRTRFYAPAADADFQGDMSL